MLHYALVPMPVPATAQTLVRALARDDVYRIIKQWIVDLQLAPGELIRDQELAASLGVSRTPVREALRRLEDEGLIVTHAHKWTKVAPSDIAEAEHLYPIVAALEATATELAQPHLSAADLKRLARLNHALSAAIDARDAGRAVALDAEFHALIVEKSGNAEIARLLDLLLPRIRRIELAYFGDRLIARQSLGEHEAIVVALSNGDGQLAADTMKKNWTMSPSGDPA
ncbi:GntR family transcriptional regulator [Burkholderia sp. MR1-5-21]